MKNKVKLILTIVFIVTGQIVFSQENKDEALEKAQKAIELMDNGDIDESIRLLKEAQKLDPDRLDYQYELAYAYYLNENYKSTIKILERNTTHENINEHLFQLLGNSYDILEKADKAFEAYDMGLKKFPNSGRLHLEKGNVYWGKKEYMKALPFYEKGIEVAPHFPSNYYRAAKIYCNSTEEVWGMIYGEIFINLERNTNRTSEISQLLYNTYKSEIKFTSDTSSSVSFSKNATVDIKKPNKIKLPFGVGIYETTLMLSMLNEKVIDINSLDRIRTKFIENYYNNNYNIEYPNILFDYQNNILKAGHLEAYNHWILMKGNEDTFNIWYDLNQEKWNLFIEWFTNNQLMLNETNKFHSEQY